MQKDKQMTPERVADYPRPPRLEPSVDHVLVQVGDEMLFEGQGTQRVLETIPSHLLPAARWHQHVTPEAGCRAQLL